MPEMPVFRLEGTPFQFMHTARDGTKLRAGPFDAFEFELGVPWER